MDCRQRLEAYLRENGVPFQIQHHPTAYSAQAVAQSEHVSGRLIAKVVVALADGKIVMLVLPAVYHADLARVAGILGVREARLAREEQFASAFPDCQVGAEPPFGNLYGLPVYVDRALTEDETIIFRAGTHNDTMSLRYSDYERLAKPTLADFARRAAPGAEPQ